MLSSPSRRSRLPRSVQRPIGWTRGTNCNLLVSSMRSEAQFQASLNSIYQISASGGKLHRQMRSGFKRWCLWYGRGPNRIASTLWKRCCSWRLLVRAGALNTLRSQISALISCHWLPVSWLRTYILKRRSQIIALGIFRRRRRGQRG